MDGDAEVFVGEPDVDDQEGKEEGEESPGSQFAAPGLPPENNRLPGFHRVVLF